MKPPRSFRDPGTPSLRVARSVSARMGLVLLALLPGIAAMGVFVGPGILGQIAMAVAFAVLIEAAMLAVRGAALRPALSDLSAPLTAVLFALALPPTAEWWMILTGIFAALAVAKHLCGGLGRNRFNPAMVGVAVVLLAFPLDALQPPLQPSYALWVVTLYALGGLFLLWKRVISWQTPTALLTTTVLLFVPFWLWDNESQFIPLEQLYSGSLILVAFFIATDPVTGCSTPRGRLVFGAGLALLSFVIHYWIGFLESITFAVLLMNATAPWIDQWARPRWLGEGRKQ